MLSEDILSNLNTIESDKVKNYISALISNIELNYGSVFKISLPTCIFNYEESFVNIIVSLELLKNVAVIYGERGSRTDLEANPNLTKHIYIKPNPTHNRNETDKKDLIHYLVDKLEIPLNRLDKSEFLDGYMLAFTTNLSKESIHSNFFFGV